jgi:hypothetical protein
MVMKQGKGKMGRETLNEDGHIRFYDAVLVVMFTVNHHDDMHHRK